MATLAERTCTIIGNELTCNTSVDRNNHVSRYKSASSGDNLHYTVSGLELTFQKDKDRKDSRGCRCSSASSGDNLHFL
jgi:hypothetical protein